MPGYAYEACWRRASWERFARPRRTDKVTTGMNRPGSRAGLEPRSGRKPVAVQPMVMCFSSKHTGHSASR